MRARKRLLAAGAAVSACAMLAACGGIDNVYETSAPVISVISKPPPYLSLIRVSVGIEVTAEPRDFHSELTVWKWGGPFGSERVEWRIHLWNKPSLPPPGIRRTFAYDFACTPGLYYTEWTTWGTSHTGQYAKVTEFSPFARGSAGRRPPTRAESHRIRRC